MGSEDEIVNVPLVKKYLETWRPAAATAAASKASGAVAEVLIVEGLEHAEVVVSGDTMEVSLAMLADSMAQLSKQ